MSRRLASFRRFAEAEGGSALVVVRVARALGSTPREDDAFMVVGPQSSFGTIGGGRLEMEAMEKARAILAGAGNEPLSLPLGPEIGQCCGGRVDLEFTVVPARGHEAIEELIEAEDAADREVWVFGGGHVGQALVRFLAGLPVKAHLVETRAAELDKAPPGVETHLTAVPESLVGKIAPASAVIVLTHDHALDFLIVREALRSDDLALIGMIGSQTKRATFESQYRREGNDPARLARLVSPIGTKFADKRPEVIAVTVAAGVMEAFAAAGSGSR